jgi:cell division transport system permease protein
LQALSVFSLAVAYVCLAAALLVVANLAQVRDRWSRAGRATVYLRDGVSDEDAKSLVKALEATAGVARARHLGREAAREELLQDSADEALAALPAEAFPSSVELGFTDDVKEVDLSLLALKLRALPTVESVDTYQRWTEKLSALLEGGVAAALCLALVVLGAVVSVVASTMRLLFEGRRREVEILRLCGATERFVARPFVLEGTLQGATGAAMAVLLLAVLYQLVRGRFDTQLATLLGVQPAFLPWSVALGMVAVGALLGGATAYWSLRRAVRV